MYYIHTSTYIQYFRDENKTKKKREKNVAQRHCECVLEEIGE